MKSVLRHIFENKQEYARLPIFAHIRNKQLEPISRLAFYPAMAFFILSFGDLNKYVLRYDQPKSNLEEMVNVHTFEDDHHWPWYLEDLTKLGFDVIGPGSDLLRFLWGEETKQSRLLTYRMAALVEGTTGVERMAIIEAIEETGNVFFSAMLEPANELEARYGIELRYCGMHHFERETGHSVGADHKTLASLTLDEAMRARCVTHVDTVFAQFEAWMHELLRYAKTDGANSSRALKTASRMVSAAPS
ncbi:MAG TPA: hypothetical protein PK156_02175 [Polyangium sp.]|nr:hypothetical protein [Polyangium sp.]